MRFGWTLVWFVLFLEAKTNVTVVLLERKTKRVHFFRGVAYLQAHVYAQKPIKPQMYTIVETYTSPPLTSNPRIFITKIKS